MSLSDIAGLNDVRPPSDPYYMCLPAIGNEAVPMNTLVPRYPAASQEEEFQRLRAIAYGGGANGACLAAYRKCSAAFWRRVRTLAGEIAASGGYFSRIVVDLEDYVIDGNHRVTALRLLGAQNVPIYRVQVNIIAINNQDKGSCRQG